MITIKPYEEPDREAIIELVLACQNDGSRPTLTVADQPELLHIRECYVATGGAFWVAKENGTVVGCIGLMRYDQGLAVMKKFFVQPSYRSAPHHLGRQLYGVLLDFAKAQGVNTILLDTPKNTERAHQFYRKAGFQPMEESQLPIRFDHPYQDCDFFCLRLDQTLES